MRLNKHIRNLIRRFPMKKGIFFVLTLLFPALVGCGYKTPTSSYDKVKTAFNGVEKSFKNISANKKSIQYHGALPKYKNEDSGLNSIFSIFTNNDIRSHELDEDISYNQPPMVQFQCLKAVFDKVGKGFEFGTKYYDNVTGEVYVNFENGLKDETKQDKNKYAFDFELAIDINIDDSDLITADVIFDIKLNQNNQNYETKWYVNLLLDYDMANSSPNYTLTMLTENDELQLPYYNHFTYEYDYVNVQNSKINEWRKFCMHSSRRLVKDNSHPSFESYINEGISYKVDYPKWFKNNNLYKLTQMSDSQIKTIGNAMYDGLGLNATDINPEPFFNKQGTRNSVIQTIYKDFTKTLKEEVVYDLVCRDEDDDNQNQQHVRPAGIRAMLGNGTSGADHLPVGGDMQIYNLFNGYIDPFGEKHVVALWYCDENGNALREINDFHQLSYQFTTSISEGSNEAYIPVEVSLDTTIKEAYTMLKRLNSFGNYSREIMLLITDSEQVMGGVSLSYVGEFDDNGGNNGDYTSNWPSEWSNYNIPEYKGEKVQYRFTRDGEHFWLYIANSNTGEADNYISILQSNGFEVTTRNDLYNTTWKRKYSSNEMLMLRFDYSKDEYLIEVWTEQITNPGGDSSEDNSNQEQQTLFIDSLILFGSFNSWGGNPTEQHEFIRTGENSFAIYQFPVQAGDKFKVVANGGDWGIHNSETAYGGFGYNDFDNIKEFSDFLGLDESDDNCNIVVKQSCELTIEAINSGTHLGLRIVNAKPTGEK